jgi:hypothetical protein
MAGSTQWFRLLNGTQKTCVAIDDPDDPGLLRAVIEQLSTVERKNWRVIVAYRSERQESLQRFHTNKFFHDPLKLTPLDEPSSKELVKSCLEKFANVEDPWLHSIYGFTQGIPGWLCLIAELVRKGTAGKELQPSAEKIATTYIDSCLESLAGNYRETAWKLLRWVSLWGTIKIEGENIGEEKLLILKEKQGIPEQITCELLNKLVGTGLVRNWGINKRFFAVEPLILRQQILGKWLLCERNGESGINTEGKCLISELVKGEIPAVDSVLDTLSRLAVARLTEEQAFLLLSPIFSHMAKIAQDGDIEEQYSVARLVEKAGTADPEVPWDILRKNT